MRSCWSLSYVFWGSCCSAELRQEIDMPSEGSIQAADSEHPTLRVSGSNAAKSADRQGYRTFLSTVVRPSDIDVARLIFVSK